jgi:NitT/TauT family transport system permease protein
LLFCALARVNERKGGDGVKGQVSGQAVDRKKVVVIGMLFLTSAAIALLGLAFCALSAVNHWDFTVFQARVPGVVFGVVIGWYRRLAMIVEPFLTGLYSTPRVALVPLILIWFGIGMWSKVFIVFINAFFPVLINTIGGVKAIDRDLLRAARSFCASDWQIFTTVVVPGSVPFILTGVRQAVALGLIGVVVGEMFGGSEGIGYMVNYGGQTYQTDTVFVGVVIIAFAGIVLTWLAERLERHFSRWRPER